MRMAEGSHDGFCFRPQEGISTEPYTFQSSTERKVKTEERRGGWDEERTVDGRLGR